MTGSAKDLLMRPCVRCERTSKFFFDFTFGGGGGGRGFSWTLGPLRRATLTALCFLLCGPAPKSTTLRNSHKPIKCHTSSRSALLPSSTPPARSRPCRPRTRFRTRPPSAPISRDDRKPMADARVPSSFFPHPLFLTFVILVTNFPCLIPCLLLSPPTARVEERTDSSRTTHEIREKKRKDARCANKIAVARWACLSEKGE